MSDRSDAKLRQLHGLFASHPDATDAERARKIQLAESFADALTEYIFHKPLGFIAAERAKPIIAIDPYDDAYHLDPATLDAIEADNRKPTG